jgi:adenylate kinase
MRVILLGGPGAGKGTQAAKLSDHYTIPHVSTGEILREAKSSGSDLGKKAAEYMDAGNLLPDDIILGIIDERFDKPDMERGFLFDGFPRTIPQAKGLDRIMDDRNIVLDAVVSIEVPDEVVIERLLKRADIEGRSDDNRETIEERLRVYYKQTEPLKTYYEKSGLLLKVDGVGTIDEIFTRIVAVLDS